MTDKEFLTWIHDRFIEVYNEPSTVDYLQKLREIIKTIPPQQITPVKYYEQ